MYLFRTNRIKEDEDADPSVNEAELPAPPPPLKSKTNAVFANDYQDMLELDDDISINSSNSPNPFNVLIKSLAESSGEPKPKHSNQQTTLLQAMGVQPFVFKTSKGKKRRNLWPVFCYCLIGLLLLLAALGGAFIYMVADSRTAEARDDLGTQTPISRSPTLSPVPTIHPTENPTVFPSKSPTENPTAFPSKSPVTPQPTKNPTKFPSKAPTTARPTKSPTTRHPTSNPTTDVPTPKPTTKSPTKSPVTPFPSTSPTPGPTPFPVTPFPTTTPTTSPTPFPITNPCALAANANFKYCIDEHTLGQCVEQVQPNGQIVLVEGDVSTQKICDGDRNMCRCPDGLPFDYTYGCVYPRNVGTFCYGSKPSGVSGEYEDYYSP